jgi:DNA-binding NarL/FixJ family response regulator
LLVDDQTLVRAGFRMILEAEPDIEVVADAADGAEAVTAARLHQPDVVLMDIRMPNVDGLEATRRIHADPTTAGCHVLILTTFDLDEYVYDALGVGASGFLLKDAPAETLVEAVHVIARGEALLAPSVTRRLIAEFARRRPAQPARSASLDTLTDRETDVLTRMARGLSNSEIAKELYLGETTVKTHVGRVLMKLGVRDRVQAVVLAYESGLVTPGG